MTVEFAELTIQQSLDVYAMPEHLPEAQITKFLRSCVKSTKVVDVDPINWTVQERMLAVSHYMACSYKDSDGFDFSIGSGKYSDYFDANMTVSPVLKTVEIGNIGGDNWHIKHITGSMSEAIEITLGMIEISPALHFLIGSMAAQLTIDGKSLPEFELEQQRYDWLVERIQTFLAYPESDFSALLSLYLANKYKLDHFFKINSDDIGFYALPLDSGEALGLPPTRFQPVFCLSRAVRDLAKLS